MYSPIDTLKLFAGLAFQTGRAIRTIIDPEQERRWRRNAVTRPSWDERNRLVAGLLLPGQSVLDVGAGAQTLRQHISSESRYTPCDRVPTSPDTVLCNLNRLTSLPDIGGFDVVVCSGVCEYLRYPRDVLGWVSRLGGAVIVTYCPAKGGVRDRFDRLASGWLCHLSESEFEAILREYWQSVDLVATWRAHRIYQCN